MRLIFPRMDEEFGFLTHDRGKPFDGLAVKGRLQVLSALAPGFTVRCEQALTGDITQEASAAGVFIVIGRVFFQDVKNSVGMIDEVNRVGAEFEADDIAVFAHAADNQPENIAAECRDVADERK